MRNGTVHPSPPAERAGLRSVNNALSILEAFTVDRSDVGVTELARTLGLGKSTVHRLLASLAARGYVRKDPQTDRYRLGLKVVEVGALAVTQLTIREVTGPLLRRLVAATRETVHLGVLEGGEVVYVDKIESQQTLQMYSRIGRRGPLHCTALGKALLAFEPEEVVERYVRRRHRAYTPATITDAEALRRELGRVRASGVALDDEEFEVGLKCIAAPVRDHGGLVVASLGIAGPAVRLPAERMAALADTVRAAAADASRALGYRLPRA
jgi:DNA-binding IclR family transcriptional regulator